MKGISYYVGFMNGYIGGWIEGRRFVKLIKKYGSLDKIPTREIRTLGKQSEMMARRQAVTLAMYELTATVRAVNGHDIPTTVSIVSAWLEFRFLDSDKIIDDISKSESIIHSLAELASILNELDIPLLERNLEKRKLTHLWEQYKSNQCLIVN